ncbi:hypothetical protein B0679_03910 [Streptococcus mitis]|jgi:hypothetical protein|uniref:Uncharacterized protein n=1 Tax=Streptococcus mitis TaxID=28037 RepID=A0A2I1YXQ1_STRMT|nr:hypothetical protein [Streptococcus mitis]MBZ2104020.1 hypothetical protein [Streptococcus mitis]OOS16285.1 hypothetical protein B0679_03910 [Streptococcus mitis]PLA59653.1 hypothetical protein CYK18_10040 [Streptococcus mitis]QBZ11218.1 hypothetical protein SM12261_0372 [Streptococcus mitis NCTC 12261]QGS41768.1 hypothetical protein FOB92_01750 [Streptococcus mitis]
MRRDISIIWLEDEMEDAFHDYLKIVNKAIEDKGYQLLTDNCYLCESIGDARKVLDDSSKRIDFFISDFNLGEEYANGIDNGIDFLSDVRSRENYKQFFILYSKNYDEIKETVITKINKEDNLGLLNNTMIINLSSPSDEVIKREFQKAIEISLSKWDELNALRGEYMSENAEIEYELKKILKVDLADSRNYKSLYGDFKNNHLSKRDKTLNKSLLNDWMRMIDKRNSLAHSKEEFNDVKGYVISNIDDKSIQIVEEEINEERKLLIHLSERVKALVRSRPKRIINNKH